MSTTAIPTTKPSMSAVAAKKLACDMYAGGWNVTDIQRYLERRGVKRAWTTVRGWVDPEWAEARQARTRTYQRSWVRRQKDTRLDRVLIWDTYTIDRAIAACRRENMSYRAIAKALKVLCSVQIDHQEVSRRLHAQGIA